jgi:carbon storage regulator CsrA
MLVLSRRLKERIVLPTVCTTVQVLGIKAGVVRLGIEAPPEVTVLREEVQDRVAQKGAEAHHPEGWASAESGRDQSLPRLRDRLTMTGKGLGLLRLQLDSGLTDEARSTIAALHTDFQLLLNHVVGDVENRLAEPPVAIQQQKALLVEDNANERELLATLLRRSGLQVDTAGDGGDALDYLRSRGKPDVILLDMGLPRVDGPTTVREIRRDPTYAGLMIFGVTGHAPEEFDLDQGPAGVDRWFQKPVDPSALLHDLTELLAPCSGRV